MRINKFEIVKYLIIVLYNSTISYTATTSEHNERRKQWISGRYRNGWHSIHWLLCISVATRQWCHLCVQSGIGHHNVDVFSCGHRRDRRRDDLCDYASLIKSFIYTNYDGR